MTTVNNQNGKISPMFLNRHLFFLLALLASFTLTISLFAPKSRISASDLTVENIMVSVNKERTQRNLLALNDNLKLQAAAQNKATDMIARHYFSHTDPEGNYIWPAIVAEGYTPYSQLGENLAIEFYDTESMVAAWMNSPTHRANILNDGFKDQGMGLNFGDTQKNQYHSAVANAFGALAISPAKIKVQEKAPPSSPKTLEKNTAKIAKESAAKKTEPGLSQNKPAEALEEPATPPQADSKAPVKPLALRGEDNQQSLNTDQSVKASATGMALAKQTAAKSSSTMPAVAGQAPAPAAAELKFNPYKLTKNFLLVFGFLLFVILATDLGSLIRAKVEFLDKKINNLAVLIISLIVIGVMYWL